MTQQNSQEEEEKDTGRTLGNGKRRRENDGRNK